MNSLQQIIQPIEVLKWHGAQNPTIGQIRFDSRQVLPNDIFVAVKGYQTDGHAYIAKAIESGAAVIVCQEMPAELNEKITHIQVTDTAEALGIMASNYYGNPSQQLKLVGVTGTNGKTTTVTLLHQLFVNLGYKAGLLSTICNKVHNQVLAATHTTPDPLQLNQLLAEMIASGCDYCFMEVSSHAAHQKRIAGLTFAGAVFSNITQDHLDYHETFAAYIKAKKMFFDDLTDASFALINSDDKNGKIMVQNCKARVHTYGLKSMARFMGKILERHIDGMLVSFDHTEIWTRFIGGFNAYNLLAVYGTALLLNQQKDQVIRELSRLLPVEGRFQYLKSKSGKLAIVDYAHTPDALENVLTTIQEIIEGDGKIITVAGAGGNRDKTKRPLMAQVAVKYSNQVILTSDNPRNEEPEAIIADMKAGVLPPYTNRLLAITNRKEAIRTACLLAQPGDIILVAGKGHETYQEVKGVKHHFDDREVILEIFETE
ncbi:MAG: UDP-N-acetylmuramoyl-L-alanyl-D-glutamate--2,6-diaminopimelate ligase [Bacteroidetes bacterium HGW-Bacteroidetes-4]|nr:MAG: UDP-N-acetylmuramoyl-L-alanyl-D-glutamate--2,6-diaminopimelate ligase [Bacteroidetes bacterium HGW-Bacteroidetes-4]